MANFSWNPQNPTTSDIITFTDNSSDSDGSIVNWIWDFDDGNVSYSQNPSHQYVDDGTYAIILTVEDDDGANNSTEKVILVKSAVTTDVDLDGIDEKATDSNGKPSDGYETYNDPNGNSNAVKSIDGDNDGKIDHFIDINNDGKPDKYWDPDDGIIIGINTIDTDNDGINEWIYDPDGDGINDKYYDPDTGTIKDYMGKTPVINHPPSESSNPSPANGSIDVSITPTLTAIVSDPDGDTLDVSFYWQNGTLIEMKTNIVSGTEVNYSITISLEYNTSYTWYAIVTDGEYQNQSPMWIFTTIPSLGGNNPPSESSNPSPANGSIDVSITPTLTAIVSDPDGDTLDVSFYWQNGTLIGNQTNVTSGSTANCTIDTPLQNNQSYIWYVTVNDGENYTQSIPWGFRTMKISHANGFPMLLILVVLIIILLALLLIVYYRKRRGEG